MATSTMQRLAPAAGLAWLVVAGYGVRQMVREGDGGWEMAYAVFSVSLLVGAAASVALAALTTGGSDRPRLRIAGLVVGGLGCAMAIVGAWALPVWMTLLGVGFALVAVAAGPGPRRALAVMAAGQLIGVVVLVVAIEAEVGTRDEYGDYPAAGGIAVVLVAVMAMAALVELARSNRQQAVVRDDAGLTAGVR